MPTPVTWACDLCGAEYRSQKEAEECEASPLLEPTLKVGDIVECKAGFGWYDGDRTWIANADKVDPNRTGKPRKLWGKKCPDGTGNCFSECCTFSFYYVVTVHRSRTRGFIASSTLSPEDARNGGRISGRLYVRRTPLHAASRPQTAARRRQSVEDSARQ